MKAFRNVDEYISDFPLEIQGILEKIRETVRENAPEAEEVISYGMPAFRQHGILVYFAAFKQHVSLFPGASGVENFMSVLTGYKTSKGTIQFSLKSPIPYDLIAGIVRFRVDENMTKKNKKTRSTT